MAVDPTKTGPVPTDNPPPPPEDGEPPPGKEPPPADEAPPPPPDDLASYMAESMEAVRQSEAFKNDPDGAMRAVNNMISIRAAVIGNAKDNATNAFGETVTEGNEALAVASDDNASSMEVIHDSAMSDSAMLAAASKGEANALFQLSKRMAHLGMGSGTGSREGTRAGGPPGHRSGAPLPNPGANPSGTPGAPGKPTTGVAGAPREGGEGSAVPRRLTSDQRSQLAHALRQKLENPPEGMTDEMRQNLELWAQALEGDGEVPEEMALALSMAEPEATDEEEEVSGDAPPDGEPEEGEGADRPRRARTGEEAPSRSRTDAAITYMGTHPPSARGSGGGSLTREERDELEARIAGGLVTFAGGSEGADSAGAQSQVYGLRALQASGEIYIGSDGVMRLARHEGSGAEAFGMADTDGVAVSEGASLEESIGHGGTITLASGRTLNLWQAGYGEGADTRLGSLCRDYLAVRTRIRAEAVSGHRVADRGNLHSGERA